MKHITPSVRSHQPFQRWGGQDSQKRRSPSPSSLSGLQASCPHTRRAEGLQGDGPRLSTCCKGQWSSHSRPGKQINTTSSVVRGREDHLNLNSDLSATSSHSRKSPCSLGKPGAQVALPPAGLQKLGQPHPCPPPWVPAASPAGWAGRRGGVLRPEHECGGLLRFRSFSPEAPRRPSSRDGCSHPGPAVGKGIAANMAPGKDSSLRPPCSVLWK